MLDERLETVLGVAPPAESLPLALLDEAERVGLIRLLRRGRRSRRRDRVQVSEGGHDLGRGGDHPPGPSVVDDRRPTFDGQPDVLDELASRELEDQDPARALRELGQGGRREWPEADRPEEADR
jgi:hypothetical protein